MKQRLVFGCILAAAVICLVSFADFEASVKKLLETKDTPAPAAH